MDSDDDSDPISDEDLTDSDGEEASEPDVKKKPKKKKAADKKKQGYLYRSTGIKTKRTKPPKWEKEGVRSKLLYALLNYRI